MSASSAQQPSNRAIWDERYRVDQYVFGTAPNGFLQEHASALPLGRVLCLAEGEGRNAVFLAEWGHEVHSVDLSANGVAKTVRLAEQRGVSVNAQVGDLADYDLGIEQWDVIVSVFAHMPQPLRANLHDRVARALKPGGVFLLEAYTPAQVGRGTGGPPTADLTMTLEALVAELAALELLHAMELEREVIEGSGHTGNAAVVQVIGRRPAGG